LHTVKLVEMSTYFANCGTEKLSLFVNSSINNILFQTNSDFISRFLNLSTLNFK